MTSTEPADRANFVVRLMPDGDMNSWLLDTDRTGSTVDVCGLNGSYWWRESRALMLHITRDCGLALIKALLAHVAKERVGSAGYLSFPSPDPEGPTLCGPPGTIDATINVLHCNGINDARIRYDIFLDVSHMPNGRVANG